MTLNPKIGVFSDYLRFLAAEEFIVTKWMDIHVDQDYLRTRTAKPSRVS